MAVAATVIASSFIFFASPSSSPGPRQNISLISVVRSDRLEARGANEGGYNIPNKHTRMKKKKTMMQLTSCGSPAILASRVRSLSRWPPFLPPGAGAPGRCGGLCGRWHWHGFSRTPQGYRWHWGFLGRWRREDVAHGDCHVPLSLFLSLSLSLSLSADVPLLLLLYCAILWMEIRLCMKDERKGASTRQ